MGPVRSNQIVAPDGTYVVTICLNTNNKDSITLRKAIKAYLMKDIPHLPRISLLNHLTSYLKLIMSMLARSEAITWNYYIGYYKKMTFCKQRYYWSIYIESLNSKSRNIFNLL